VVGADVEHRRRPGRDDHADEQPEQAFDDREADPSAHAAPRGLDEALVLALLLAERLNHAQPGEHLLDHRQRRAVQLLGGPPPGADPSAIGEREPEQQRRDRERDQHELPVDPRADVDHARHGERRRQERSHPRRRDPLDGHGVVLDPVGRVRRAAGVVIRQRKALAVTKELRAQLQEEPLAGQRAERGLGQLLELGEERDRDEEHGGRDEHGVLRRLFPAGQERREEVRRGMRADPAVDGDLQRQRSQERERCRQQADRVQPADPGPLRPRDAHEPAEEPQVVAAGHPCAHAARVPSRWASAAWAATPHPTAHWCAPRSATARAIPASTALAGQ
jgi:hypothetical protein